MEENMQKKNKKIGTPLILIILIVLLVLGIMGILVYILINVNSSKTNKQNFYSAIENIFNEENGFVNKELKEYFNRKSQKPYENNMKIDFDIESNNIKNINNFNIQSVGQIDKASNSMIQDIKIEYSEDINNTFTLKKQDNKIGIKYEDINPNYIAMKTENIKEYENILGIMTSLERINNLFEFNLKKIEEGKKIAIINTCINWFPEEKFSNITNEDVQGYKLSTTLSEIDGLIKEITKLIDNDIQNESTRKIISTLSSEFSKNIKENVEVADQKLQIAIYLNKNNVNKINILIGNSEIAIEKKDIDSNNIEYLINQNTYKSLPENQEKQTVGKTRILKSSYQNIKDIEKINEIYKFQIDDIENNGKYTYDISNNIKFSENIKIEDFDNSTMYLNEPSSNIRKIFLENVEQKLINLNKEQMSELDIKENNNPLNYIFFRNKTNFKNIENNQQIEEEQEEQVNENNMENEMGGAEIEAYNTKFERYQGTSMQGTTVKGLMTTIIVNINEKEQTQKITEINFNGQENKATQENVEKIKEEINLAETYKIEFEKTEKGIIDRAIITVE